MTSTEGASTTIENDANSSVALPLSESHHLSPNGKASDRDVAHEEHSKDKKHKKKVS